jgi:hypothetical protein
VVASQTGEGPSDGAVYNGDAELDLVVVDELRMITTSRRRPISKRKTRTTRQSLPLEWLLEGDPAIRWQALRDLASSSERAAEKERERVAREGWGARLLALQDPAGTWAGGQSSDGGLYSPKWISTTYTMLLLRDFGLSPRNRQTRKACGLLLERGLQRDGGINYGWRGSSETCITGMVLSILSYFEHHDDRLEVVLDHVLERQMPDGGWNCALPRGATHASVHTTISVLEGLRHYEVHRGRRIREVRAAQRRGREFLLAHRLFRSHRTGEVIKPVFTRFAFPPRWHYDVLRALDHFQEVDAPYDERLEDAIALVHAGRDAEGRWRLEHVYRGKTYFEMERLGQPSRWNTLRALRVLEWWDRQTGSKAPRRATERSAVE